MKKYLYIVSTLILMIAVLVHYLGTSETERNPNAQNAINVIPNDEGLPEDEELHEGEKDDELTVIVIGDAVNNAHQILNEFVGWGGSKRFNFSSNANKINSLIEYIELGISHAPKKDIETDLHNALKVLETSQQNNDIKGLLIAHRILHDLDGYINKDPLDGKVWGYTLTVSGSDRKAKKYIES